MYSAWIVTAFTEVSFLLTNLLLLHWISILHVKTFPRPWEQFYQAVMRSNRWDGSRRTIVGFFWWDFDRRARMLIWTNFWVPVSQETEWMRLQNLFMMLRWTFWGTTCIWQAIFSVFQQFSAEVHGSVTELRSRIFALLHTRIICHSDIYILQRCPCKWCVDPMLWRPEETGCNTSRSHIGWMNREDIRVMMKSTGKVQTDFKKSVTTRRLVETGWSPILFEAFFAWEKLRKTFFATTKYFFIEQKQIFYVHELGSLPLQFGIWRKSKECALTFLSVLENIYLWFSPINKTKKGQSLNFSSWMTRKSSFSYHRELNVSGLHETILPVHASSKPIFFSFSKLWRQCQCKSPWRNSQRFLFRLWGYWQNKRTEKRPSVMKSSWIDDRYVVSEL